MPTLEEDLETLRVVFEDGDSAAAVAALGLLFPWHQSSSSHALEALAPIPVWLLKEIAEGLVSRHFTPARKRRDRERWNDQIRYYWVKLLRVKGVKWEEVYEQTAVEVRRIAPESAAGAKAIKDSYLRERRRRKKPVRGN